MTTARTVGDLNANDIGHEVVIDGTCYSLTFISHNRSNRTRIVATWSDATTDYSGDRTFRSNEPALPLSSLPEQGEPT